MAFLAGILWSLGGLLIKSVAWNSTAIKHITALEASLIPVIEPILNPVWVFLVIGEAPGQYAVVGGAIVLLAVTGRYALNALRPGLTST